ncbi:hypothetical protein E3N88_09236 [Mikania micrantha]|uniref:Uncharacterized protein n=1 Tax=Mikania micrantha TaxID=192012 RepID=A0A5N6PIF9_9ASTR|nr:hypothetical protein E3N88_09236 [Mikania micrantha]
MADQGERYIYQRFPYVVLDDTPSSSSDSDSDPSEVSAAASQADIPLPQTPPAPVPAPVPPPPPALPIIPSPPHSPSAEPVADQGQSITPPRVPAWDGLRRGLIFVNFGHPLGGRKLRQGKIFTLNDNLKEKAHRYALFNSDNAEVYEYINEHEAYVDNQPRKSRWEHAQVHSHEFASWLKEKFSYSDDPFVMPSQVKHVFYVPDPIEDGLHYVINMVPRDIYDFEEENKETDGDSYWCEPNEDVDANDSESCDDSDHDDTLWDWMNADEDDAD